MPLPSLQYFRVLKEKIAAFRDLVQKERGIDAYESFLETTFLDGYELAKEEMVRQYGCCDRCLGMGVYTVVSVPEHAGEKGVRGHFYYFCKRGRAVKEIIDAYYRKI